MTNLLSAVFLAAGCAASPPDSAVELRRQDLMAALQHGGLTVILRHARTDRSFQEQITPMPTARSEQRNLSEAGVRDAALMGVVFRKFAIPFSEILSSPMYRAVETAEMAAGKPSTTLRLRSFPTTVEQAELVKMAPARGSNRLLVTHHFVIEAHVPGIRPGEIGESEAVVVRHLANGDIELVGRISLDDWASLASPGGVATLKEAPKSGSTHITPAHAVPASEFPHTHAGRLAKTFLGVFNSNDSTRLAEFIASSMAANPNRTQEERHAGIGKLFDDLGPLSLQSVEQSDSTTLIFGVNSRKGLVRLTLKTSAEEPMKVSSLTFGIPTVGAHR